MVRFDAVQDEWVVQVNDREQYMTVVDTKKLVRARPAPRKKGSTRTLHLYMMKTGSDVYKIGCTSDVKRRVRAARTWCPEVSIIATRQIPSKEATYWRRHEMKVHDMVRKYRCSKGGTEVHVVRREEVSAFSALFNGYRF